MTAEQIAERLHARRCGRGWMGKCPAHADKNPSLSIREGRDGRVLFKCFAGCTFEAITTALREEYGIQRADLFPGPPPPPGPNDPHVRVLIDPENIEIGIARALALAVIGDEVEIKLRGDR